MISITRALVTTIVLLLTGSAFAAEPPITWTEFGSDGNLEARTIVAGDQPCPPLVVDKKPQEMQSRGPKGGEFPVKLCRATLPAGAKQVTLGGRPVATLKPAIKRILVIGDTGCRIEEGHVQNCTSPKDWPFAAIARRAAAMRPDLIIHVGDYFYREDACPEGNATCKDSPIGDKWDTWNADFFKPAAPLLSAAPWVTVRGNHELCERGGHGWFLLLDPHPDLLDCPPMTEPYAVHLNNLDLFVVDSADADDFKTVQEKVDAHSSRIKALFSTPPQHAWLLTHRPFWTLVPIEGIPDGMSANASLQVAIRGQVPDGLDLILSGHVHDFMSYDWEGEKRPAQMVVGDSGDELFKLKHGVQPGTVIDDLAVRHGFMMEDFGFVILDRAPHGWRGTVYGDTGKILARCDLAGRSLQCHH